MHVASKDFIKAIPECERFTIRDVRDRDSTDGFVKVPQRSALFTLYDHLTGGIGSQD